MKKFIAILAPVAAAAGLSLTIVGGASAQVTVPPGQDFYATPMSSGGVSMAGNSRIVMPAPVAAPEPVAAPVKKSRKRRVR